MTYGSAAGDGGEFVEMMKSLQSTTLYVMQLQWCMITRRKESLPPKYILARKEAALAARRSWDVSQVT